MVARTAEGYASYKLNHHNPDSFRISTKYVSSFLFALARFFGVSSFTYETRTLNLALDERLKQLELTKWSKLLEEDLAAFFCNLDEWNSWDEVFFINRHFERLLLEVGVIADQLVDGSIVFHMANEHRLSAKANVSIWVVGSLKYGLISLSCIFFCTMTHLTSTTGISPAVQ